MSDTTDKGVFQCPICGRVASVPEWCSRPICLHSWNGMGPEIWDGDNVDGEGREIEQSARGSFRQPGPDTWSQMIKYGITTAEAAAIHKLIMFADSEEVPEFSESEIKIIWALNSKLGFSKPLPGYGDD